MGGGDHICLEEGIKHEPHPDGETPTRLADDGKHSPYSGNIFQCNIVTAGPNMCVCVHMLVVYNFYTYKQSKNKSSNTLNHIVIVGRFSRKTG